MRSPGVVLALLLLACSSSPPPSQERAIPFRDATIVLPFGSSTQVTDGLMVSFVKIAEDSRCPASVTCVWQGNAAIRLDLTTSSGVQSATLNTAGGTSFPREAAVAGYTFTLLALEPQRQTADPIPLQEYRATIRVSRSQ